jgi:energy-coupling factor transport system permease protein
VSLHPATRILCLVILAAWLPMMRWPIMLALLLLVLLPQVADGWRDFRRLVRRARWLLASVLLIYAFATPGEFVAAWPECCAPTYEGLHQGMLQALRLLLMLAALSLVLARTSREGFIAGIWLWLRPLAVFGISAERFATRLWLTLHYVENTPPDLVKRLRLAHWRLAVLLDETIAAPERLHIPLYPWGMSDVAAVLVLMLAGWWII